jgi:dihydrodipicolinate synthase/N-acetylneuraminate lyase
MRFEGIICPMISPFTLDGRIYADGVRNLIEFLRKNSVNGIFVYGAYGLGPAMSIDERKKIAELSVEHASGKMNVIIHVGPSNIDTSIEPAKHAEDVSANVVVSTPPFYTTSMIMMLSITSLGA